MKKVKVLLFLVLAAVMVINSSVSVCAIGFSAEETYESVFVITSGNALGSGFAVGENCIITNAHVIGNQNDITVRTYNGKSYVAKLVGINKSQDIAVLTVSGVKFTPITVADYKEMNIGSDVYAIGTPKSMDYTLTKGILSAKERNVDGYTYIQIDAPVNEGNSGGPLLNDNGQVIGVITLKLNDSEGIGFAIPMSRVKTFIGTLDMSGIDSGSVGDESFKGEETVVPEPETPEENERIPEKKQNKESKKTTYIALGVAGGAVLLGIIIAVIMLNKKKKDVYLPFDPRDRTDFEIDILE